jgi:hypothetical protein
LPTDPTVSAMSENGYENVKAEIATEFVSITQNVINAL